MLKFIAPMATALALVAAAPAAADDPSATFTNQTTETSATQICETPYKGGQAITGGYYIDGCTVRLTCKAESCAVGTESSIVNQIANGTRVKLNTRLARFAGAALLGFGDESCDGVNLCTAEDATTLRRGESATVQCNGVREGEDRVPTMVSCQLNLNWKAEPASAPTPAPEQGAPPPAPQTEPEAPAEFDTTGPAVAVGLVALKKKKAVLQVTCPAHEQTCTGDVAIVRGAKTIGSAVFTLAGGQTTKLRIALSKAKRRKLIRAGQMVVRASAYDAAGQGLASDTTFDV
jgi:hypothetical protein